MPRVKQKPPLERGIVQADRYVGEQLLGIMKDMRSILRDKDADSRSRVSAGAEMLKWAKPAKGIQINQNFAIPIKSRLGLPEAPETLDDSRIIDVKKVPPAKILPEPPRSIGDGLRPFAAREVAHSEMAVPADLIPRQQDPRSPDKPAPVKDIKAYE